MDFLSKVNESYNKGISDPKFKKAIKGIEFVAKGKEEIVAEKAKTEEEIEL